MIRPGRRPRRGFTAVEIAMVATVIAILALLVLPIFRARVAEARLAAARDELDSIAKAQILVEADTGIQARLQDLDNPVDPLTDGSAFGDLVPVTTANQPELPPIAAWNGTLGNNGIGGVPNARRTVANLWKGPYLAFKNTEPVVGLQDYWFDGNGGYITVVGNGTPFPQFNGVADNVDADLYPIDPWGNPYVLFGKGLYPNDPGAVDETRFNTSIAVSLGPDGLAGDALDPIQIDNSLYIRFDPLNPGTSGAIGVEGFDDIIYRF